MQNYSFLSQIFSQGFNQNKRAFLSSKGLIKSATGKICRSSLLFVLGLAFFCSVNILLLDRHQLVEAAVSKTENKPEAVANLATGDRLNSSEQHERSNQQTAIVAQVSASNPTSKSTTKIPKHLDNFDENNSEPQALETHSSNTLPENTADRLNSPDFTTKNKSLAREQEFVNTALVRDTVQSPTSLEEQFAIELPPLSSPEQYLPAAFDGYIWPARGTFTSGYGWRWGKLHQGIDIAAPVGTPVMAAAAGTVTEAEWTSGGYGNLIKIQHSDGSVTVYAHNNKILVSVGQTVEQNQQIAEMGNTGYSTGSHLHFEIHPSGDLAVDPMAFLSKN